jgi:hypothetical protein
MKTFILRCESFDTRASLEDRLKWVKAGRVLLIMPDKQPPALTRQDLVRLRRRASDLHAQLGLVTSDDSLQENGRSAGLDVFSSKDEARLAEWRVKGSAAMRRHPNLAELVPISRQTSQKLLPAWLRWLIFSLAVLAILTLLASLVPGAQVELNLPREEQSADLTVPANLDQSAPDLIAGIPLHEISLDVNATIVQETTGSISVGDKPATGLVLITNLSDQPLIIPIGSVVRSVEPAMRFSVEKSGRLPAGPDTSISLPVTEMDGAGLLGNLPAGAIVAMDPPLGLSVSVTNPEGMTGGSQKQSPALSQLDISKGNAAIENALNLAFIEAAQGIIPEEAFLIADSIVIESAGEVSTPPPDDRPITSFDISRSAEMTALYCLTTDLEGWATLALDASLDESTLTLPDSLNVEIVTLDLLGSDQATVYINAVRQTIPVFNSREIAYELRGLKPAVALSLIQERLIPGSQPEIQLSPSWWIWLPIIPERIRIDG